MQNERVPLFHRNATVRWAATGIAAAALLMSITFGVYRLRFIEGAWGLLLSSFALIVLWGDRLPRRHVVAWTTLALLGTLGLIMIHSLGFYLFPAVVVTSMVLLPFTVRNLAR